VCAPSPTCLSHLQGDQLPEWIEAATATIELPSLRRFAQHLERDLDAVIAGLSHPWNSGVVEGHVNRIKMLKRQMFGTSTSRSTCGRSISMPAASRRRQPV
jgi:transposase